MDLRIIFCLVLINIIQLIGSIYSQSPHVYPVIFNQHQNNNPGQQQSPLSSQLIYLIPHPQPPPQTQIFVQQPPKVEPIVLYPPSSTTTRINHNQIRVIQQRQPQQQIKPQITIKPLIAQQQPRSYQPPIQKPVPNNAKPDPKPIQLMATIWNAGKPSQTQTQAQNQNQLKPTTLVQANRVSTWQQQWNQLPQVGDAPGSYSWGYKYLDEAGNQMFREESADGFGTVWGRYSFRDVNGIIRIVEYISDSYGYRTRIRTNEPGVVSSNPAGAEIIKFDDENNIPLRRRRRS